MRLIELFEADPVDLAAFRKQKASNATRDKISNLATNIPNMFSQQEQQEAWFNSELEEILKRIDAPLKKHQMEIRPLAKEYDPGTPLIHMLYFNIDENNKNPDSQELMARKFAKAHKWEIRDALKQASEELRKLTMQANEMEWPADWRRYTRYSSFALELSRMRDLFEIDKRKLFEDGRIIKGVNTTMDVDTDEIPKQARKYGFKTDVGGIPPTLRTDGKF